MGITCLGLYHFKKGSADGRMLIWKVSSNIIKDYPILGVGQDQFKAYYCDYQADYFRNNTGSEYESLAVDNQFVFNEFINIWVENGIVGLIIFMILLFFIFKSSVNLKNVPVVLKDEVYLIGNKKTPLPHLSVVQLINLLKASILSIIVFGCFAYPSEILPIKVVVVVCLAMLSTAISSQKKQETNSVNSSIISLWLRISSIFAIAVVFLAFTQLNTLKTACTTWTNAYHLYQSERYDDCLIEYEKAWPELKNNGDYLLNYGKALCMTGSLEKAIEVLERSKSYSTSSVYYTSLGDSYLALHQNSKAKECYKNAHFITPAKFYPKYLLAKYYYKTGDIENAKLMAQEVLQKQIKVKSTAIDEIFKEMQMILNGGNNLQANIPIKDNIESNQTTHTVHTHEVHPGIVPFRLNGDTCSDGCTDHNHLNKRR